MFAQKRKLTLCNTLLYYDIIQLLYLCLLFAGTGTQTLSVAWRQSLQRIVSSVSFDVSLRVLFVVLGFYARLGS